MENSVSRRAGFRLANRYEEELLYEQAPFKWILITPQKAAAHNMRLRTSEELQLSLEILQYKCLLNLILFHFERNEAISL